MNFSEEVTGTRLHDVGDLMGRDRRIANEDSSNTLLVPPQVYAALFDEFGPDSEPRTCVRDPIAPPAPVIAAPTFVTMPSAAIVAMPSESGRAWAQTIRMEAVQPPDSALAVTRMETPRVPASRRSELDEMSMVLPIVPQSLEWIERASEEELANAIAALRRSEGIDHVLPPANYRLAGPDSQRTGLYVRHQDLPVQATPLPALPPVHGWPVPVYRDAPPPCAIVPGGLEARQWAHSSAPVSTSRTPPGVASVHAPAKSSSAKIGVMIAIVAVALGLGALVAAKMRGPTVPAMRAAETAERVS